MLTRVRLYLLTFLAAAIASLALAAAAGAADRVYWSNSGASDSISWANLDGSGGGDLDTGDATLDDPQGVTIDAATGRIYWANTGDNSVSYANLDGSGGADLNTTGATMAAPIGVAIDPAGGRIYIANGGTVSYAALDGSGGDDLDLGTALDGNPTGVAVDPAAGRAYYGNDVFDSTHDTISIAQLDGSGGFDLVNETENPYGVAVSPNEGTIYWSSLESGSGGIYWTGANGGPPVNTNSPVSLPHGVALDETENRFYWINQGGVLWFGPMVIGGDPLDQGTIPTTGATMSTPGFPALLKAPNGAGAPTISGARAVGSKLACSRGTWARDQVGGFLYQVPSAFEYRWTRDGASVPGASSSTLVADQAGEYRCRVSARNFAGSASQTSAAHDVESAVEPSNAFTVGKAKRKKRKGTARLPVTVAGPGELLLTGKKVFPQRPYRGRPSTATTVDSADTIELLVKAKGNAKRKLKRTGKARVRVTITFTPSGGTPASQDEAVKLRLVAKHG